MITTITISLASLVCVLSMLAHKQRELVTGKTLVKLGGVQSDYALRRIWGVSLDKLAVVHPTNSKKVVQRSVVGAEKHAMKAFHVLSRKFAVVGDVVTGKEKTKNRGSVSFFLKNIEDSKKQSSL